MIFEYQNKKMFYEFFDNNSSTNILLLHGWGGNHNSMNAILPAFSGCNIISVDFFGFGQSDKVTEDFSIYTYADAVYQLVHSLNLQNIILVGHSFGGRISIILASLYDNIFRGVILIDSAGIKSKLSIQKIWRIIKYKTKKILVKLNFLDKSSLNKCGSSDYQKLTFAEKIVFNKIVQEDLTKYLPFVCANTLIIWGAKDKDTPLYMAKKIHRKIKNSQLFVLKDAGHFSYLDQSNATIKLIRNFLKCF